MIKYVSLAAALFIAGQAAFAAQEAEVTDVLTKRPDPIAMYRATGTTPDQDHKLRSLVLAFETLMVEKGKQMVVLMKDLKDISQQPEASEKAALSKQAEINSINNQMSEERLKLMFRMRAVLTPEQRKKLVTSMKR